jgi:site-specific DNA-methyltransferase (adenine-specific)
MDNYENKYEVKININKLRQVRGIGDKIIQRIKKMVVEDNNYESRYDPDLHIETNSIVLGDCLEKMNGIPDDSVDMVLCDPPYGTTACKWDSVIDLDKMWRQILRISNDFTVSCIFGQEPFSSLLRTSNLANFRYDWIWEKNKPTGMFIAKYQPMKNHETISVFYKKHGKYYPIKEEREWDIPDNFTAKNYAKSNTTYRQHKSTERKQVDKLRFPTTIKEFDCIARRVDMVHPTQKPTALFEYLIKTYTKEGDLVLDFAAGSGTTGVACQNLEREFILIEKDPEYYEVAHDRVFGERGSMPC